MAHSFLVLEKNISKGVLQHECMTSDCHISLFSGCLSNDIDVDVYALIWGNQAKLNNS
jgi:hypothetical protein